MFLATSLKEEIIYVFQKRIENMIPEAFPTVFTILLPSNMRHGDEVLSPFDEKEFLFPPYSVFTVKRVNFDERDPTVAKPWRIELEAEPDNKAHQENLPLSGWH